MLALKYLIDEKIKLRHASNSLKKNQTQETELQTELSTERGQSSH